MSLRPDIAVELTRALADLNQRFDRLPVEVRESLELAQHPLDCELDEACLSGEYLRAHIAIDRWHGHYLRLFEETRVR